MLGSLEIFSLLQNETITIQYEFNDLGNKFQGWMTIFLLDLDQQKIRFFLKFLKSYIENDLRIMMRHIVFRNYTGCAEKKNPTTVL